MSTKPQVNTSFSARTTLILDTSSKRLTLALFRRGQLVGSKNLSGPKGKSHQLTYILAELLKNCRISLSQVELVGCGFGPGSYTGLRIGLAALKALMIAKPTLRVFSFSSLDLIASRIHKPLFGVVVDARRERIYCNFYRASKEGLVRLGDRPLLLTKEDVQNQVLTFTREEVIYLAGDALVRYKGDFLTNENSKGLRSAFWYPRAEAAGRLVENHLLGSGWLTLADVKPQYMRLSEAEEKWGVCS